MTHPGRYFELILLVFKSCRSLPFPGLFSFTSLFPVSYLCFKCYTFAITMHLSNKRCLHDKILKYFVFYTLREVFLSLINYAHCYIFSLTHDTATVLFY